MTRPVESWEDKGIFEVSSAEPDATPVWVDLTSRIRDMVMPTEISIGRQNDLDQSEPSRLTLVLENADDALTFGNTASPYAAWWGPGRRCRLRESIAGTTLTLFTGFVEVPDELVVTTAMEARVTLSAVDRLGRLEHSPLFVSTLTEHIRYTGGTALKYYWTLSDASGPSLNPLAGTDVLTEFRDGFTGETVSANKPVLYANAVPIDGDEISGLTYDPNVNVTGSAKHWVDHRCTFASALNVPAAQSIAIVVWLNSTATSAPDGPIVFYTFGATSSIMLYRDSSGGHYWLSARDDTSSSVNIDLGIPTDADIDAWRCLAVRITESTGEVEFWHHGDTPVTTTLGGALSAFTLTDFRLGGYMRSSMVHAQIYVGAGAYSRAAHLAQVQKLWTLERQSTGDRIRTLAQYAGLPTSEIANTIDPGSSVMQRALLAGKDPLTAMREAEVTEQGLLHTDGDGNLVFKDRKTLYNI